MYDAIFRIRFEIKISVKTFLLSTEQNIERGMRYTAEHYSPTDTSFTYK